MRMRAVALLLSAAGLFACGAEQPLDKGPAAHADLRTYEVGQGSAASGSAWDGIVEAVQQADLSAQTGGRIREINVDIGDRVDRGEMLLRITAFEQRAGENAALAQLRAAEAAASEAESSYRRFDSLAAQQYVSRAQLDQARAARDSALAAKDAAQESLVQARQQAAYTVVHAPFDGIVSSRLVEPGETVAPGQPLVSMYAPGALRIEVQVPQSLGDAVRESGSARIELADGRGMDAAEVQVFPAADPSTHSVGVRVLLPDVDRAPRPGSTAKVVFPVASGAGVLRIPTTALVQRGELSGVYVVAGDRILLRQVRVGRSAGDHIEVLAGLKAGDRIAADPVAAAQALAARREASTK